MNPLIHVRKATTLFFIALACFAVSPGSRAISPPPDGGYPIRNTAEGTDALLNLTSGVANTAIGFNALLRDTSGNRNTATGAFALSNNTTGFENTATGVKALGSNTFGAGNTATGVEALFRNTTGSDNTANGLQALFHNTIGVNNTATGVQALLSNTLGSDNTANGSGALQSNTTGNNNTADGAAALSNNTTGFANTATGDFALFSNTFGADNTAIGVGALLNNTRGISNIALGGGAGANLFEGDNNIDIGNEGIAVESNTIRIGTQGTQTRTFVAGIRGSPITGTSVVVNTNGRLGTVGSSQRFKDDIKPMDKLSEAILALKPVTFRYKKEIDPEGVPQFGLVAEDGEKVNRDLVMRDADGKVYTVRYEAVNAMLLNEFLKEHQTVQELKKQVAALTAGLQKVSVQLELNKPAPQTALNNQ
jgi:Chaperone of endosialidase